MMIRNTYVTLFAFAFTTACAAAHDGAAEDGVGGGLDELPAGEGGAGAGTDPDSPYPAADTDYEFACYAGADGAYTACAPLVPWDPAWGSAYGYPSHGSPQYTRPLRLVDLSAADPGLQVAPNFVLSEVMQEWKGRYGVFQRHVVKKLQAIRDASGGALHINSGYRSPAYNASVSGATYSRHMFGDAADMRSSVVSLSHIGQLCHQENASYVSLYSSFVHCDWRNHPLDESFYGFGGNAYVHPPVHTATLRRDATADDWRAPATGFDEGEPLRQWTAYDQNGEVLESYEGERYTPPKGTTRLLVVVGGQVEVETKL